VGPFKKRAQRNAQNPTRASLKHARKRALRMQRDRDDAMLACDAKRLHGNGARSS
jgi:hypothetical protein